LKSTISAREHLLLLVKAADESSRRFEAAAAGDQLSMHLFALDLQNIAHEAALIEKRLSREVGQ
jgi:hypothetical protein